MRKIILKSFFLSVVMGFSFACHIELSQAAETFYFVYDAPERSVTSLINQAGDNVANTYAYSNFGKTISSVEAVANNRKYVGEQYESETNLIFLRARYYDPATGRFIAKDPIPGIEKNPQSLNPYPYCNGNPVNYVDPTGKGIEVLVPIIYGLSHVGSAIWGWFAPEGAPGPQDIPQLGFFWGTAYDLGGLAHAGYDYLRYNGRSIINNISGRVSNAVSRFNECYERRKDAYYSGGSLGSSSTYAPSWMKSSYGGVSLSKTAELMLNIQDVGGATFDPATGQVILYGKQNVSLPNMELDDLSVAVSSVYGLHKAAQDPGVSIGTEPSGIPGQMKVRYDGETFNTKFGLVMFDSDRLLKCLSLGKDNITSQAVTSSVPGYQNMHNMYMGVI